MGDTVTAVVEDLVRREAPAHDVEVLDVECKGQGSRQLVRVVVDRKGGVPLDVCQALSSAVSRRLDELDPIGGRYTLEVTSPGVDRPLTDQAAFDRVEGRDVVIDRRTGDGVEQLRGRVVRAGGSEVEIDDGTTTFVVAYADVVKATQALPW